MNGKSLSLDKFNFYLSGFYIGNVPAYQKLELIDNLTDNNIVGANLFTLIVKIVMVMLLL